MSDNEWLERIHGLGIGLYLAGVSILSYGILALKDTKSFSIWLFLLGIVFIVATSALSKSDETLPLAKLIKVTGSLFFATVPATIIAIFIHNKDAVSFQMIMFGITLILFLGSLFLRWATTTYNIKKLF